MSLLSYATQKVSPLTLIEGPFTDLNWASLGADYTLRALLESQKYCTVVVVAFDRPKEDIVSNAMDLKGENLGTEEKLRVIEALDVFSGGTSLSDVYEEISRIYLESKGDGMIAVLVYSISSVCLTMGWGNTKRFLDKLTAFVNNPVGTEETDGIVSRDFLGRGTVVGTINDSLHSRQQLAMLRGLADTYCKLTPNSGSLSATVAVEAHIIRRSVTASGGVGRVAEVHELFMFEPPALAERADSRWPGGRRDVVAREWVPMRLVSLPKVGDTHESREVGVEGEGGADFGADSVLQSMLSKAGAPLSTGNSSDGAGESRRSETNTRVAMQTKQRLVTFSSTDQEFDEDSDPDADLDL